MSERKKENIMMIIKKLLAVICCLTLVVGISACSQNTFTTDTTDSSNQNPSTNESDSPAQKIGTHHAVITVKGLGEIKLELYGDIAPITVQNFMDLANSGFYDGLTFHRVISGFVIQGGDPKANGTGGSDKNIKGEFAANGVKNSITHVRGVISMARASSYDSASSQFFIVHQDNKPSLDGLYAGFGKVTEGMDVVDKIAENTPVVDSNGTVLKGDQPVIESVKIID